MTIATITRTMPATIAIFAVLERLLRCGRGNCGAAGGPVRPALASATIFRTSDLTLSFRWAGFNRSSDGDASCWWVGTAVAGDCARTVTVNTQIARTNATADFSRACFITVRSGNAATKRLRVRRFAAALRDDPTSQSILNSASRVAHLPAHSSF